MKIDFQSPMETGELEDSATAIIGINFHICSELFATPGSLVITFRYETEHQNHATQDRRGILCVGGGGPGKRRNALE